MIGTTLIEEFVQSVALTHRIKDYSRVSALLIAAPESGKTTITKAAQCHHVAPIAVMSGRSILKEVNGNPKLQFLIFNDLTTIKAMSTPATNLLIAFLNQLTQGEKGRVGFAGKDTERDEIKRAIGIIGCIPFKVFADKRSRWKDMGFVSRMIPFAYAYDRDIIAEIKDAIDDGTINEKNQPVTTLKRKHSGKPYTIIMPDKITVAVRRLSDARAQILGETGIRLLGNYHSLIRAHALLKQRGKVTLEDLEFLKAVDTHVSVDSCPTLSLTQHGTQGAAESWQRRSQEKRQSGIEKRERTTGRGTTSFRRTTSTLRAIPR